ncbi:MAG: hypothetical protein ACYCX9_02620 [Candidatus Dormibacteria bacterium]
MSEVESVKPAPEDLGSDAKRTTAMLRDARSVQRRLDILLATAAASDDPSLARVAEARAAVERLVLELTFRQHGDRRGQRRGRSIR